MQGLSEEEKRVLDRLLDSLIPPDEKRRLPGGAHVGFAEHAVKEGLEGWIRENLACVGNEAAGAGSRRFLDQLMRHLVRCYYRDPNVIRALGLPARPPFPDGYHVPEGDILLLEPVFLRGKVYRDAGS